MQQICNDNIIDSQSVNDEKSLVEYFINHFAFENEHESTLTFRHAIKKV